MSSAQGYASRLSPHGYKGKLNLPHVPDPPPATLYKSRLLARKIRHACHVVIHTGAGISTSAGICDFRGPQGIWTNSQARKPQTAETSFEDAVPTLTHMAIKALHERDLVQHVVSQNVDGLHLRSGLPREALSELHGNLFVDWCEKCQREFGRDSEATTVGLRGVGRLCECGGELTDKALDWDDELPQRDLERAVEESERADLCVVVGTSCQMEPARGLPFGGGEVVLVNLSRTDFDARCAMVIRAESDVVFAVLMRELDVGVGRYERFCDVVVRARRMGGELRCRTRVVWDGKETARMVGGIKRVRYRVGGGEWREGGGDGGYPGVVEGEGDVAVEVEGEDVVEMKVREGMVKGRVKVVDVDYGDKVKETVDTLEEEAREVRKRKRVEFEREVWFVRGRRKGWKICVICGKEVWCGSGKRERHFEECL